MKMTEIRKKAKALGILPEKKNKTELIHAIQSKEGNTSCYGLNTQSCPYMDCCFRDDCLH